MSIEIDRNVLQKLTHESSEIRVRTLEHVEGKILRALAHNVDIKFKPGDLCKQLIRFFGHQPLLASAKVLDLLARILRSKYGDEAVQRLGLERFKREIGKVQNLLGGRLEELQIVQEILTILQQHGKRLAINDADVEIIDLLDSLTIEDAENGDQSTATGTSKSHSLSEHFTCPPNDYETPWSKASIADFNSMKFLADILINPLASAVELQNSLQHLQITMADYPAEYLLQAPNIYLNLLKLFERADEMKCPLEDVATTLLCVLQLLKRRLHVRRQCITFAPQRTTESLTRTQLKVERAMHLLLHQVLKHLKRFSLEFDNATTYSFELIATALDIYSMLHLCVDMEIIQKVHSLNAQFRTHWEQDEKVTIHRIKYVLLSCLLQDMVHNNAQRQPLLDGGAAFQPLLRDFPLRAIFPQRHEQLVQLLCHSSHSAQIKEQQLKQYEHLFATAMSLLKAPSSSVGSTAIIAQSMDICVAVEKLQSVQLVERLFNAIVDCNAVYPANSSLRQQATQLLQRLIQLRHGPLKSYAYSRLATAVKKHFACLMNGECYCAAIANSKLLACQIIGVPFSTALLQQLIIDSNNSACDVHVQQHCVDLLCMLLKAQHLLAEHWDAFVELLLPTLPLLQACTQRSSKLMQQLLQLYDPDAQHLPFLTVLQGNIVFLFHRDAVIRAEAITRLIYILNALETASEYVPNVMEISDLIPSDLCYLDPPRDFARIFAHTEIFSEVSTLHNLLSLLDSRDIEPLIRKTTLMQLNVMCQDWEMAQAFCRESAHFLVLHALENAMRKQSFSDYTDAAIPAIGILCKVLFCDADSRHKLANTINFYVLLLRALMTYQHDIQVRQDASICLMQLLYADYMVVPGGRCVQLPAILANLQLPLRCEFITSEVMSGCNNNRADYDDLFSSASEETTYLRYVLAISHCNGDCGDSPKQLQQQYLTAQKQLDFCASLQLTERDWRIWKATAPAHNLKRCISVMTNATEHRTLMNSATMLKLVLQLVSHSHHDVAATQTTFDADLYTLLSRYLHMPPGNEMDFLLYEVLLDLSTQCVRLPLPAIVMGMGNALQADFPHAFLMLLKNAELPVRLFAKICRFLVLLLRAMDDETNANDGGIFYSSLFELLYNEADAYFQRRDLQRVRCLLSVLQACSMHHLDMTDKLLQYYCKRFLNLSIAIKAITQTGAQWQRDCLQQICQLHAQMDKPDRVFQLNSSCLKYLSGLCGHSDAEVRAFAWRLLTHATRFGGANGKGAIAVIDELSYLPGGFLACCLSTLLDHSETMRVRQLAGELYAALLTNVEEALKLLDQHAFFHAAHESLCSCLLDAVLPRHFDFASAGTAQVITCEIVSVYCRICIALLHLRPDYVEVLCEKPFMCKLYELLKLPPAHSNPAYYDMCADICHVYRLCYERNFPFLQRTLCRDQVWLVGFCQLLQQPLSRETDLVQLLQLLLCLGKDATAYAGLCENFAKMPQFIVELCSRALDVPHLKTHLQQSVLAVLTLLLTQSQAPLRTTVSPHKTFVDVLALTVDVAPREPLQDTNNKENDSQHINNNNDGGKANRQKSSLVMAQPKRREPTNVPLHIRCLRRKSSTTATKTTTTITSKQQTQSCAAKTSVTKTNSRPMDEGGRHVAAFLCHDLFRLYNHVYTANACKFTTTPSACQMQISESLGALLQCSSHARATALHLKLFERVLRIFKTFFEETTIPCTTFVRRYGEKRKMAVVKNFLVLLKLLHNWHASSTPVAAISSELNAHELAKTLIQIWPWVMHSADLKVLLLQVCDVVSRPLSPGSTLVCQKFSAPILNYVNSVLQLIVKFVVFETTKVKAATGTQHFAIIQAGMRVLRNCCACADGRACLLKERVLDTFDGFYPFNAKSPKLQANILHEWLEFWEVFSTYSDGAKVRNLNAMCMTVLNLPPCSRTRLFILRIMRNMCCLSSNRTQLMTSEHFLSTIYNILAERIDEASSHSYEEQFVVTVATEHLIAGGVKYVAMIRGSKLEKKFRLLYEHLQTLMAEDVAQLHRCEYAVELLQKLEALLKRFNSL